MAGDAEGVFGSVGALHNDGFAAFADFLNRAIDSLHAIFANAVDFDSGFLGALFGVVDDDFGAFFHALVRVLGAGSGRVGTMNGGFVHIVDGALGAVLRLHHDRFGAGIDLGHGAVNCGHDIVG